MIRHCVFINFNDDVSDMMKRVLFGEITKLKSRLPGMQEVHIASNSSPETGMDKGFSEGFIVDFADAAARNAYLIDEEHKQIGSQLVANAKGGVDGILVYDLEID